MVFVTVGSASQGFPRLLKEVDRLTGSGLFGDSKVVMQVGHTKYEPVYCQSKAFFCREEFQQLVESAGLVICHGGATPLEVIRLGKIPVVMPRRKQFGEIVNDHQVEFSKALARKGWIILAMDPEELLEAISIAAQNARQVPIPSCSMLEMVSQSIEELCH